MKLAYQIGGGILAAVLFWFILSSIKWIILGLVIYVGVVVAGRYYNLNKG